MNKRIRDRVACGMADTSSGACDRHRIGTERSTKRPIPSTIGDTLVEQSRSDPIRVRNEYWVTLVPTDGEDDRLWEFSLTTGRLIQTREHLGRIL